MASHSSLPADGAAPAIVPLDVPGETFTALPERVRQHALRTPDAVALRDDRREWRWAELAAAMDAQAGALQRLGVRRGDTVALLAETDGDHVLAYLAGLAAGGCVAPLPLMATDATLARLIADSGAVVLVADAATVERAEAILALPEAAARPPRRAVLGAARAGWADLAAPPADPGAPAEPVAIGPDDLFNIIYSSGTTGTPKGIVHDHRFRARQAERMREFGIGADTRYLVCTPMYSNTTLVAVFPTLAHGGTLTVMRKFDTRRYLERVAEVRPTHVTLVPVLCQRLMGFAELARHDTSSIVSTTITSAPLSAHTKAALLRHWPGEVYEMYGLTEGGVTTALAARAHPDKLATVGTVSRTAVVKLIDEAGREVPPGEVGEVIGRSIAMMRGYHGQPALTQAFLHRHADGHTYFRTGDLGRFDADGFLSIVGRKKDVIISGGFNIYAVDLEDALLSHPGVLEAAVVGIPSEAWGETPIGVVVRKPGAQASADEILAHANQRVGRNQRLQAVHLAEAIARNALGKVDKPALQRRYAPGAPAA